MAQSPYYAGRDWPAYQFREYPKEVAGVIVHSEADEHRVLERVPAAKPAPSTGDLQKQLAELQAQLAAVLSAQAHAAHAPVAPQPSWSSPMTLATTPERDSLLARAEAAGVDVDKRWGNDRLRQAVEAAEAPNG